MAAVRQCNGNTANGVKDNEVKICRANIKAGVNISFAKPTSQMVYDAFSL